MGKKMVINGADFSENALNVLETNLYNEVSNGKFKVDRNSFTNLSSNPAAGNWQIEWIDVSEMVGKKLSISYGGIIDDRTNYETIVFLNDIPNQFYPQKNFSIATYQWAAGEMLAAYNVVSEEPTEVIVPEGAVGLLVSFIGIRPHILAL